ncbi:hypothetical protein FAI41_03860 [Acetobacteraceae bacterium]|nr:hypothetical protein FAI41_03860 [Acetobacteraceae bacterium]
MELWLQTRGLTSDYAFLGEAPPERWWTKTAYQSATSFELPTLILERYSVGKWRCFVSAIPSRRRDRVNTRIRYSLVLQGSCADQEILFKLLGHVLEVFRTNPVVENSLLTDLLDDLIRDKADEWLSCATKEVKQCVNLLERKMAQLQDLPLKRELSDQLQKFLTGTRESAQLIAMFNFIASEDSPSVAELRTLWNFSQGNILLLASPVDGGNIDNIFLVKAPPMSVSVPNVTDDRKKTTQRYFTFCFLGFVIIVTILIGCLVAR